MSLNDVYILVNSEEQLDSSNLIWKFLGLSDIRILTRNLDSNDQESCALLVAARVRHSVLIEFKGQDSDTSLSAYGLIYV